MNKKQLNDSLKNSDKNFNENYTHKKEQIIVDGVNIIDCDNYYVEQETDQVKCDLSGEYCRENKNCFYKQLARKTYELEVICKAFDIEYAYDDDGKIFGRSNKLRSLEQEYEELKEQLQANQPTGICETCMAKAILQNDKYRKTLKEIGKIVKINCEEICGRKFEDCNDTSCFSVELLGIVNKAKGEENA